MLHKKTVNPATFELLQTISKMPIAKDLRLVGGTSLALQYGHRTSIDLDFFGMFDFDKDEMLSIIKTFGNVKVLRPHPTKNVNAGVADVRQIQSCSFSRLAG